MLTNEVKKEIIEQYAVHEGDTGSPEVETCLTTSAARTLNVTELLDRNSDYV